MLVITRGFSSRAPKALDVVARGSHPFDLRGSGAGLHHRGGRMAAGGERKLFISQ